MGGGALDVGPHASGYVLRLFLRHLAGLLGGDTDYEAAGGEPASFGDEGAGGHDRALAYLRPVEDPGAHPDEAAVLYLAPVHDRVVADNAVIADYSRVTGVCVQHAAVLDVGAGPDPD